MSLNLWISMDRSTFWARAVAEDDSGLSGREADRGPGRDVAQGGWDGRRGGPGAQCRGQCGGQDHAAAG